MRFYVTSECEVGLVSGKTPPWRASYGTLRMKSAACLLAVLLPLHAWAQPQGPFVELTLDCTYAQEVDLTTGTKTVTSGTFSAKVHMFSGDWRVREGKPTVSIYPTTSIGCRQFMGSFTDLELHGVCITNIFQTLNINRANGKFSYVIRGATMKAYQGSCTPSKKLF